MNDWPKDTDNEIYRDTDTYYEGMDHSLAAIMNLATEKWPGIMASEIGVSAKHIQTQGCSCCGYDPFDHTTFIVLTASDSYFERVTKAALAAQGISSEEIEKACEMKRCWSPARYKDLLAAAILAKETGTPFLEIAQTI